jgi:8-oxo-dGTP pyrophosphatase MutT (NUDIX family)
MTGGSDWLPSWLRSRQPVDGREAASIRRFLAELERLDRPFDRHADPVHITASAIVLGPDGVVLHRHKRLGLWLQPGGHVDPGERPDAAAVREAREETGLDLELTGEGPIHVDVHGGGLGHVHLDLRYLVRPRAVDGASAEPAPPAGESQDVRWFGWPDALAAADPGLRALLVALQPTGTPPGD